MKISIYGTWLRAAVGLALLSPFQAAAQNAPEPLRLLQRSSVPQSRTSPTDIRWASDDSVYISWQENGVAEVKLDGVKTRAAMPERQILNQLNFYYHIAVTPEVLVAGSESMGISWRLRKTDPKEGILFHFERLGDLMDFDVASDRLLLLGLAEREKPFAAQGVVAWTGPLAKGAKGLKPVLRDAAGPGAASYYNCRNYPMGAVRFLADGSFVVAPGFQDGVHLYAPSGQKIRSWSNRELGIDSHVGCAGMSEEDEAKFRLDEGWMKRWAMSHTFLEEILPLPQGPGLLVRSWGKDGRAHWTLKVLEPQSVRTYAVPVTGRRPLDRLQGDVRNGKIALLLLNNSARTMAREDDTSAELFVLEMPKP